MQRRRISVYEAQDKIKGYLEKYYCGVRDDVFDWNSFQSHLYGYIVSLSHDVAKKRGWPGHNWRQEIRKLLLSYAYDEIDRVDRRNKIKRTLVKVLTLGWAK